MKYVYNNISEKDIELLLQDLNVTNQDDILVHGSELDKSNYDIITNSIFNKGISKNTSSVAPFMSILATTSLLNKKYDLTNQITSYHIGNAVFVLRIPREYKGLYFGNINQKYAGRVSGIQDECVSILDLLELENIPPEFVVCSIKKSNEMYGKYDVVVNPRYFEIDKDNTLDKNILKIIENNGNEVVKAIVKDYMNLEKLDKDMFSSYMDLLENFFLENSDFSNELYDVREKKISSGRK